MATNSLDAPVMKEVGEAVRALAALQKILAGLVAHMPASIPPDKAKAAAMKVRKYMERYAPVTKISGSKVFEKLSPQAQEGVKWIDGVIADLMAKEDALRTAARTADLDFAKDPKKAIKQIKAASKEAGNPSWATGTIAKVEKEFKDRESKQESIEQLADFLDGAKDIGGVEGSCLNSLGLVILLHWIWKYLKAKGSSAPKV